MLKTRICDQLGIELPIVSAGMGGVATAKLAAAVSEAGGLGTIALVGLGPEAILSEISAARKLTSKPLAVNVVVPLMGPGVLAALADAPVDAVAFFWGDPAQIIPQFSKARFKVLWQCGSTREALAAKDAGVDIIIAQGFDAGGHVRGITSTVALIPEMRDALGPDTPMIAAGGFADGRGLAAAIALGADAVAFGTRFIASDESAAHPAYKQAILRGHADDTIHTKLYDVGWPDAAHRVLRTSLVEQWERAGCPPTGKRPGEGESIGHLKREMVVPMVNYSVMCPTDYFEGDPAGLAFYSGMSCSLVHDILPAAEIVRRIADEASAVIRDRLASLV